MRVCPSGMMACTQVKKLASDLTALGNWKTRADVLKGIARRAEVPDLAEEGPNLAEEGSSLLRKAELRRRLSARRCYLWGSGLLSATTTFTTGASLWLYFISFIIRRAKAKSCCPSHCLHRYLSMAKTKSQWAPQHHSTLQHPGAAHSTGPGYCRAGVWVL